MNNDEDLLETNGLVSTKLFDISHSTTVKPRHDISLNDDTSEYLNTKLYSRDPINISNNLSKPWPTKNHKNDQPVISNIMEDITEVNYTKYKKSYISIDDNKATYYRDNDENPFEENFGLLRNSELNYKRYVLIPNARYIINLNKPYNDIYKIKLVDFGIYNLSINYNTITDGTTKPKSLPIVYTPYILLRVQPLSSKEFETTTNFEVASSESNKEKSIKGVPFVTNEGQLLTYSTYDAYTKSLSKIRFYRPRRGYDDRGDPIPLDYDDFIEPIYADTEMIYKNPIQNVTRLLITIYDSSGNVYSSMQQHHFTLEVTEKINVLKNTNINTKDGEIDMSGVTKSNPLLFN